MYKTEVACLLTGDIFFFHIQNTEKQQNTGHYFYYNKIYDQVSPCTAHLNCHPLSSLDLTSESPSLNVTIFLSVWQKIIG